MKIVVLDGYTLNPGDLDWSGLESLGEVTVYERTPYEDIFERAKEADVLFTNKTPLNSEMLSLLPKLKYVGVLATGYNVVDVDCAKKNNVVVTNIPTYGTRSVSQFVFALLMEVCHRVGHHGNEVAKGQWSTNIDWCFWDYPLIELASKTMGIIGYGRIGQQVAEIAAAFGMNVLAYDKFPPEQSHQNVEFVDIQELYARSDVISLHCPLFEDTKHLINEDSINEMKDGVIIVNTSRGPLINEDDLYQALRSGKVYAAALDVLASEPPSEDTPLFALDNCIITPHIAWAPKEARARLMDIAVDNLRQFSNNKVVNCVNGL